MRFLLCATLLIWAPPALGQARDPGDREMARAMLMVALDNIQRARCESGQPCAPATPAEKANPPLTVAEADRIVRAAALSAAAERCGLDWQQRNFLPMMEYWRKNQRKNERQMALVALVHGIVQEQARQMFASRPPCTDEERRAVQTRLPFFRS